MCVHGQSSTPLCVQHLSPLNYNNLDPTSYIQVEVLAGVDGVEVALFLSHLLGFAVVTVIVLSLSLVC